MSPEKFDRGGPPNVVSSAQTIATLHAQLAEAHARIDEVESQNLSLYLQKEELIAQLAASEAARAELAEAVVAALDDDYTWGAIDSGFLVRLRELTTEERRKADRKKGD